jgi:hypothetical protein
MYRGYFLPNGVDFSGMYEFCMKVRQQPHAILECGEARGEVIWSFKTTGEPDLKGVNGWILQYVQIYEDYLRWDCRFPYRKTSDWYFEAWPVRDGIVYLNEIGGEHGEEAVADLNQLGDKGDGTKGFATMTATVTFIPGYNLTSPPWERPGIGPAEAPTMWTNELMTPKGFWTDGTIPQQRILRAEWDCCNCHDSDQVLTPNHSSTDVSGSSGWWDFCIWYPWALTK